MPIYYYKAKDKTGEVVSGMMETTSTDAVVDSLSAKKLSILEISENPIGGLAGLMSFRIVIKRVSVKELVIFFRQLAVMIDANMPLVKSLRIMTKQTKNEYFRQVIGTIADEVDGGNQLSVAMAVYPTIFSKFYINIVKSGETSGRLSEVMNYLADQKEKDYDLESKVKGAMIYPAFILAVLGVVGFIAMAFIIPNITDLLVESGAPLPLLTRILMGVAGFFNHFWWLIIIVTIGLAGGWLAWIKTEMGRNFFDQAKLHIPVFGKIFRQIYIVRICRSFATLVRGGVPIATALDIVKEVADNKVYEKILAEAVKAVDEGNPLSEALLDPNIPVVVSQLVSVGEETGKLDEVLERAAEFYAREVDNMVKNLSTLIEPAIMVFLGLTVGLFVAAVILPMWQLSSSF